MGKKFNVEGNLGVGELSPGATERRWEPEGGLKNHNKKIHIESRYADEHKNLPFEFSKPRRQGPSKYMKCNKCGYIVYVSVNTIGIICKECNAYVGVEGV